MNIASETAVADMETRRLQRQFGCGAAVRMKLSGKISGILGKEIIIYSQDSIPLPREGGWIIKAAVISRRNKQDAWTPYRVSVVRRTDGSEYTQAEEGKWLGGHDFSFSPMSEYDFERTSIERKMLELWNECQREKNEALRNKGQGELFANITSQSS